MLLAIDASRANRNQKTGVEWYAFHLIQELKKIIPETVGVVLYTDEPLRGELAELPEHWSEKVLRWPPRRLWTQIRMSWEMMMNPPDVLFIPAHVPPLIHPKKTVVTIHDIAAVKFPETYNWFERWYSVFVAKYSIKNLWRIIVPSDFTRQEILKLEIGNRKLEIDNRLVVVHHGYGERYRKIDDVEKVNEVLKKYGIQRPFLLSVGRLEEKKNTVRIVKAFELLRQQQSVNFIRPVFDSEGFGGELSRIAQTRGELMTKVKLENLNLLLVGKPGHGYEKVQEAIDASPFRQNILVPGWIDEQDLPYIMNAAEVFLFPSLYEGFGLPVLQAFASGVPVVASQGSSLEEVGSSAAVYVDPMDEIGIKHGIEKLLVEADFRAEKIGLGFERVQSFSWQRCAEETLAILLGR